MGGFDGVGRFSGLWAVCRLAVLWFFVCEVCFVRAVSLCVVSMAVV